MWTGLPTVAVILDCRPDFSFFFDLVGTYSRAETANTHPLHRVCTLARKQGVSFAVVEDALSRIDVKEEIDALDIAHGGGGAAEAIAISFFDSDGGLLDVSSVTETALLGQAIIISYREPGAATFSLSYIYEAVFRPPMMKDGMGARAPLLNNFVCRDATFEVPVRGRTFSVNGVYYAQQNGKTSVCAHASLRMALNTFCRKKVITSNGINSLLQVPPNEIGLQLGQIEAVANSIDGVEAKIVDCEILERADYLSILGSIAESGDVALLVFTTSENNVEHVVTVFGHTKNSDEWHPQAIILYAGPKSAPYYGSASWIDHFLIHDDNLGPYFSLSARALEVDPKVKPHWIIGLHKRAPTLTALYAEAMASIALSNVLPTLAPFGTGKWFEYITRNQLTYVLRALLVEKERYLEHLKSATAHDDSKLTADELNYFASLPDVFWMVEFSLPDLFTGNHSKLGEVLFQAFDVPDTANLEASFIAMRVPGMLLVNNANGNAQVHNVSLGTHCPILSMKSFVARW